MKNPIALKTVPTLKSRLIRLTKLVIWQKKQVQIISIQVRQFDDKLCVVETETHDHPKDSGKWNPCWKAA